MTRKLESHCQCDNCSGDDCRDLPKPKTLKELTREELIDELSKREGVRTHIIDTLSYGRVFIGLHNTGEIVSWETCDIEATIFVVKK